MITTKGRRIITAFLGPAATFAAFAVTLGFWTGAASATQTGFENDPVVRDLTHEIRQATDLSESQLQLAGDWALSEAERLLAQATGEGGSAELEELAIGLATAGRRLAGLSEDTDALRSAALTVNRNRVTAANWIQLGADLLEAGQEVSGSLVWHLLWGMPDGDDAIRAAERAGFDVEQVRSIGNALRTVEEHANALFTEARRMAESQAGTDVAAAQSRARATVEATQTDLEAAQEEARRAILQAQSQRRETTEWIALEAARQELTDLPGTLEALRRTTVEWGALEAARAVYEVRTSSATREATAAWQALHAAEELVEIRRDEARTARSRRHLWRSRQEADSKLQKASEEWEEPARRLEEVQELYRDTEQGMRYLDDPKVRKRRTDLGEEMAELFALVSAMGEVERLGSSRSPTGPRDRRDAYRRASRLWNAKELAGTSAAEARRKEEEEWEAHPARAEYAGATKQLDVTATLEQEGWEAKLRKADEELREVVEREGAVWAELGDEAERTHRARVDELTAAEEAAWRAHPARVVETEANEAMRVAADAHAAAQRRTRSVSLSETVDRLEAAILASDELVRARGAKEAVSDVWAAWDTVQAASRRLKTRVDALRAVRR